MIIYEASGFLTYGLPIICGLVGLILGALLVFLIPVFKIQIFALIARLFKLIHKKPVHYYYNY